MNLPCIDLHGLTRDDAIATVANFLNAQRASSVKHTCNSPYSPVPAVIITGSGKHSHCGPVLRPAIEKYLQKREMNYVLNKGKGSFTVDCTSGIDLYFDNNQNVCTKVIIASNDEISKHSDQQSNNWSSTVRLNMKTPTNSSILETRLKYNKQTTNHKYHGNIATKSDQECATQDVEEPQIRELLEQSKLEHEELLCIQKMTDSELDDAIEKSELFIDSTVDISQKRNEKRFLTHLEQERQKRNDEEQLSAMIKLSQQMEERRKKEIEREEIALQRILELSQQEIVSSAQQEEDELLSKAIALSLHDKSNNKHLDEEEEKMIQEALALSIRENKEQRLYSDSYSIL
jgi:hypothetical protein